MSRWAQSAEHALDAAEGLPLCLLPQRLLLPRLPAVDMRNRGLHGLPV